LSDGGLSAEVEVPGKRKAGSSRKTWRGTVKQDLEVLAVDEKMTVDRRNWREIIASPAHI